MMRGKRLLLVMFGLLVISGATTLAMLRSQNQQSLEPKKSQEKVTEIQDGKMTEKQRQHSKLFKHAGRKLSDIEATQTGDIDIEEEEPLIIRMSNEVSSIPKFQSAVCNADAVVTGSIVNSSSQVTEEGTFVFTDSEVTIDAVIKNNAASPIDVGGTITTTRDGGAVRLHNRVIRARRLDFDAPIDGKRYLLFLRFIPTTGSYLMYGNGTFQVDGDKVLALGPAAGEEVMKGGYKNALSFLEDLRAFAKLRCQMKVETF